MVRGVAEVLGATWWWYHQQLPTLHTIKLQNHHFLPNSSPAPQATADELDNTVVEGLESNPGEVTASTENDRAASMAVAAAWTVGL